MLTIDDIRRERTVKGLRNFVDSVLASLTSTDKGSRQLQFGNGPIKRLKEEVCPALRFAERYFPGREMSLSFPADNGPFDAILRGFPSAKKCIQLQITTAAFSYKEHLRLEALQGNGAGPGFGPVWRDSDGQIQATHKIYMTQEAIDDSVNILRERICRKQFHQGMWLLIDFNDEALVGSDAAIDKVVSACTEMVKDTQFSAVFIVGTTNVQPLCRLIHGGVADSVA
jgi:hypothetical protein